MSWWDRLSAGELLTALLIGGLVVLALVLGVLVLVR